MSPIQKTAPSPFRMLLIHREELDLTKKLTVTLYGNDQGANNVLDSIADAAGDHADVHVIRIPGLNVAIPDHLRDHLHTSSAAIFGISSGMPEARVAAEALKKNPDLSGNIFFAEDYPGSSGIQDPVLREIGRHSHLCSILTLPEDAPERAVYRAVHAVGYPDHWLHATKMMADGMRRRAAGRITKRRRGTQERIVMGDDEVIVYFSGFSEPELELKVLHDLFALKELGGRPLLIHFRPHPTECNRGELERAIRNRDAFLDGQWEIAGEDYAGTPGDAFLIGLSDVTITHPGTTSVFFAAPLRKKIVCVMDFVLPHHWTQSTVDYSAAGKWSRAVRNMRELPGVLTALLRDDSAESVALRKKQEKNAFRFDAARPSSYGTNVMEVMRKFMT